MVIVDMRCLRSVSKIRRELLMHNTSDAIMVQFIQQNSMIYSIKCFLKIEKNVISNIHHVQNCMLCRKFLSKAIPYKGSLSLVHDFSRL